MIYGAGGSGVSHHFVFQFVSGCCYGVHAESISAGELESGSGISDQKSEVEGGVTLARPAQVAWLKRDSPSVVWTGRTWAVCVCVNDFYGACTSW